MDPTNQQGGAANDRSHSTAEPGGDLFANSSGAGNYDGEESFPNEYAAVSQAREFGRSPRPIERPQSSRPNTPASPDARVAVTTTEPLATEFPAQDADLCAKPIKAAPSAPVDAAKQTGPVNVPRLMTVVGVAEYLEFSVSKVWRLRRRDPDFPQQIKIGGSSRWDLAEIDRFIEIYKARRPNGR